MYMSRAHPVHMTEVTLTELRKNLFKLVDRAIETGEPLVVRRKGRKVLIQAPPAESQKQETPERRWKAAIAEALAEARDDAPRMTEESGAN